MTHKTRAQQRIDELEVTPTALLSEIDKLKTELDEVKRLADEYLAGLQRERAEFVNFRRRTTEERERDLGLAGESLIRKVLAIADDFDRAIEARPAELAGSAWADGIGAIDRKLRQLLESEGVSPIEAVPGTAFDPRTHEAIVSLPGTGFADGSIVEEVQRGYLLRDRVLRPSLVAVAISGDTGPGPDAGSPNQTTDDNTTPGSPDAGGPVR